MPRSQASARKGPSPAADAVSATMVADPAISLDRGANEGAVLVGKILEWLDDAKAEAVVAIDIKGKTSIGD